MTQPGPDDPPRFARDLFRRFRRELQRAVVGQEALGEQLLIAVLCQGHCLFEAVPGSGRFLLARSVARVLGLEIRRIACTPDLSPNEALDSLLPPSGISTPSASGPQPPHVLYIEEIDRGAPKTQAALLETTTNRRLTVRGNEFTTPTPFLLIGAQSIDEHVPRTLTATQRDRFLFGLVARSPSYDEEYGIAAGKSVSPDSLTRVVSREDLERLPQGLPEVTTPPPGLHYALRLVRGTRVHEGEHHDFVYEWLRSGAGPRAAQLLVASARARALLHGRREVDVEDLRSLAYPVLRHRLELNQNACSRGITVNDAIDRLLSETPEREDGDERVPRLFRTAET